MRCLATGFGWAGRAGVSPPNARCRARSSAVVIFAIRCHLALRGVVAGAVRWLRLLPLSFAGRHVHYPLHAAARSAYPCQALLLGLQADLIMQQLGQGRGEQALTDLGRIVRGCAGSGVARVVAESWSLSSLFSESPSVWGMESRCRWLQSCPRFPC